MTTTNWPSDESGQDYGEYPETQSPEPTQNGDAPQRAHPGAMPPEAQKPARLIDYLKSWELWLTVLTIIGLGIGVLLLAFEVVLPLVTRHNESIAVPRVVNMKAGTALGKLEDAGLEAQVDSQYVPALPAGTVLRQEPRGLARVKPGRPVYLVVNKSQPPDVKMPDILETNVSQATYMLQNWDLQVGEIHYITGRAKNEVQRAEVNGTDVQPGDPVVSGSEVDLYVSRGLGKGKVALPDLTGLKLASAKAIMEQLSLQLGFLRYDSTAYYPDSMIGRVVLQDPKATGIDSVREGIEVSLMVAGTPADVEDQDIDPSEIPPAPETEGSPGAGLPGEESGLPEDFD